MVVSFAVSRWSLTVGDEYWGWNMSEGALATARRAVAPVIDSLALQRFDTLTRRGVRARDSATVTSQAVRAFDGVAHRVAAGEEPPPGFADAVGTGLKALRNPRTGRSTAPRPVRDAITEQFHRLFYHPGKKTWKDTRFRGVRLLKCPFDLWVYQELLHEVRPDVIIEAGTKYGGSAFYMANICDLEDHGKIVTIDVQDRSGRPDHPRITYLTGSSTDPDLVGRVDAMIPEDAVVLAILDSDHSRDHVRDELEIWSQRVTSGSYVIVEDSNVHGHPVHNGHRPGPWEATRGFLRSHPEYEVDRHCERYGITFNPNGYLKRRY